MHERSNRRVPETFEQAQAQEVGERTRNAHMETNQHLSVRRRSTAAMKPSLSLRAWQQKH
jgi:hypothetical protein